MACQVVPTCLALPYGFVERGGRKKPVCAHLHAPFVLELGNLLCRPDAVIVLVVTAAGLRQRGKCGENEWCPPAPHLGGWCCGLRVVVCADASVGLPGKTRSDASTARR